MGSYFPVLNLLFMENCHFSIHMAFWKESMINRLSNLINRNRSAAKISQVLCSSADASVLFLWLLCCANCLLNSLYVISYAFSNYALSKYEHMNIKQK